MSSRLLQVVAFVALSATALFVLLAPGSTPLHVRGVAEKGLFPYTPSEPICEAQGCGGPHAPPADKKVCRWDTEPWGANKPAGCAYCNGGKCVNKLPAGTPSSDNNVCQSNVARGGFCDDCEAQGCGAPHAPPADPRICKWDTEPWGANKPAGCAFCKAGRCVNKLRDGEPAGNEKMCRSGTSNLGNCVGGWSEPPAILASWMDALMPAIGKLTIFDLALPGTHDTVTYNLQGKVIDSSKAGITDKWTFLLNLAASDIARQAVTQTTNIGDQLRAGVRFLDMRITYDSASQEWYGCHLAITEKPATAYLTDVAQFLAEHKSEIVVMWLTFHGDSSKPFPLSSVADKQRFWQKLTSMFGDMLYRPVDGTPLGDLSVSSLVTANQRFLVFAAEHDAFTGGKAEGLDAVRFIDNMPGDPAGQSAFARIHGDGALGSRFTHKHRRECKERGVFCISSLAFEATEAQRNDKNPFGEGSAKKKIQDCVASYSIPNFAFCPVDLFVASIVMNYYSQSLLVKPFTEPDTYAYPPAIYIDALAASGGVWTGSGREFPYALLIVLWNLRTACAPSSHSTEAVCDSMQRELLGLLHISNVDEVRTLVKEVDDAPHGFGPFAAVGLAY